MAVDVSRLPEEVQGYIQDLESRTAKLEKEKENFRLLAIEYRRQLFARKTERLVLTGPEQERLFNEAEAASAEQKITKVRSHQRRKKKSGSNQKPVIPEGLPELAIHHEASPEQKTCPCCEEPMQQIGTEEARELLVVPEKLVVHKHIYPKFACSACRDDSTIRSIPRNRFLPGSVCGTGLLAYILQRKYQFGLPLYRISSILASTGAHISRQTMCNWILAAEKRLHGFADLLKEELKDAECLHADETTLQVLREPGRKENSISYMWLLQRAGPRPVYSFEYQPGRSTSFLQPLLQNYTGVLMTDGYGSYAALARQLKFVHAGCWAHARRPFHKALQQNPKDAVASEVLKLMRKLFAQEKLWQAISADERLKLRREQTEPIVSEIHKLLKENESRNPPKSPIGKAISYCLNQWLKLSVFLENGHAPLHNNDAERAIRPFVIGRKNWIFSVSQQGARASALFYSLIESAKANDLNPYDYLTYLFEKWPTATTDEDKRALLPNRVSVPEVEQFVTALGQV